MKRQASSEPSEPQVKHARTKDKLPRPIDLSYRPQEACSFLQLPRELRDQIYADAFGTVDIGLVHSRLEYFISCRYPFDVPSSNGLPQWVRTCKQMTEEATEFLARTRWFCAVAFPSIYRSSLNPLVFRPGNVRSIIFLSDVQQRGGTLNEPRSLYLLGSDPATRSLIFLKHLQIKEGQLHIIWRRWWHESDQPGMHWFAPDWHKNEPFIWTKSWTEYWTGRFRKVSITVSVHTDPDAGYVSTKLVALAETLATRLVGPGGTATWENSYSTEENMSPTWIRCVTVERKT